MHMNLFYCTHRCRTSEERAQSVMRLLLLCLLAGIGMGTLCHTHMPDAFSALLEFFGGGLAIATERRTLWDVFCSAALPVLLMLGGLLLAGCSAFGQPIVVALLLLRGFAIGVAGANCFAAYGLHEGLALVATMLLPEAFFSGLLLVCAAKDSLRLSARAFHYLFYGTAEPDILAERRQIHLKWLALTALSLAVAALHTALVWGFAARLQALP